MGYKIAKFPQGKYRFQLYDNIDKLTWQQIQQKTGCYALCNLWYFDMWTYKHDVGVMLDGKWVRPPQYTWPGICVSNDGKVTTGGTADAVWGYAASVQADYIDGRRNSVVPWGDNGVTYTGLNAQGDVVILLCSRDTPMDSAEAVQAMLDAGCVDILRWDGSWSSQGSLGPGMDVQPSQKRICRGYLLVFERDKEEKPVNDKKTVCLDPGHGKGNANGSADGTYKEHEFNLDLCNRIKPLLEKNGVEAVMTRTADTYPSLTARASVSNNVGADLFVSVHTNASGSSARGFIAYTSSGPESAERNKAAASIISAVKKAGVLIFGSGNPYHEKFTVLTATIAPAVLLECGFHTNPQDTELLKDGAYRDKLAVAITEGILDYLGVDFTETDNESGEPDKPSPWAEEAWNKAVALGVFDGSNPQAPLTREQAALVLDRLGLISDKGGK